MTRAFGFKNLWKMELDHDQAQVATNDNKESSVFYVTHYFAEINLRDVKIKKIVLVSIDDVWIFCGKEKPWFYRLNDDH